MKTIDGKPFYKKSQFKIGVAVAAALLLIRIIAAFPATNFNGNTIRLFSVERLVSANPFGALVTRESFNARILGSHVLETEYGEIALENFASVEANFDTVGWIGAEVFTEGRPAHNLAVAGITIPKSISVAFSLQQEVSSMMLNGQEVVLSNIPIRTYRLNFRPHFRRFRVPHTANVELSSISFSCDYITLVVR